MNKHIFYFCLILFLGKNNVGNSQSVLDKVDLFICTDGDHGQLDPAATVPFGMIKVGPDTAPTNHSGYDFSATELKGFSHNRIGGVGCKGAGGNLRVLSHLNYDDTVKTQSFDKATEKASPGYYTVRFNNKIKTELTATNSTAIHKYTFPKSEQAAISLDLKSSFANLIGATKKQLSLQEFTTSISAKNVCNKGRYTINYHIKCDKKPLRVEVTLNKIVFHFKTNENEEIGLFVTASGISEADAISEWNHTKNDLNFEDVLKESEQKWTAILSKIEVDGKEEYEKIFYTHLYHLFLNPVKATNKDGFFKATDGQVYKTVDYTHYDTWSMWDNFRNKFSLYALILPEVTKDIARSLENLYRYGKPHWSGYHQAVPTVRTEHSIVVLLDFYKRGITNFDAEFVYRKMSVEIDNVLENSPDQKLEKAYDYWALSEFAALLGKTEDQKLFLAKAKEYKDTWKKFFSAMGEDADVMHARGLYEGTLWQYRWHTQFDVDGLIDLFGSKDNYTHQLEYFFENNLYNHGNQPDIHVPYLFNYSSKPWLTQKWVNKILTKNMYQYYGTHKKWKTPYFGRIYKAEPKGYIPEMDDDEGTMSAWYVLSAMGFYPVSVGNGTFQMTAPIFKTVKIHLPNNKIFEIITQNLSDANFYINKVELNNKHYNQLNISHQDIMNGGKLVYKLSNTPLQP